MLNAVYWFNKHVVSLHISANFEETSITKHYRPLEISTVFSKLMAMAILEDSSEHDFNMLQFCFVTKRGTNTAISLAYDVIQYINKKRSSVICMHA